MSIVKNLVASPRRLKPAQNDKMMTSNPSRNATEMIVGHRTNALQWPCQSPNLLKPLENMSFELNKVWFKTIYKYPQPC